MKRKFKFSKVSEAFLEIGILIISVFAFSFMLSSSFTLVSAQTADYCCEKTDYGAWCMNAPEEDCNEAYRKTPTSCDATSFCKQGCCYESSEGLCMENTPQRVCDDKNGTWSDSKECEIPQCELGCCVLDNQAALVTLTRCKKLTGFYGLETDFRTNIDNEMECIAITQLKDRGACVFEEEWTKMCKFTTREQCQNIQSTGNLTEPEFYKNYLCSAEELGTICGMTPETMCVDGKDEVYFKDSCGNPANIYDANKKDDPAYWKEVLDKSESCNPDSANAGSGTCGNCDYYLGSICKKASRQEQPEYGNYICQDLNCYDTTDGDKRHGESWCNYDGNIGEGKDSVGSRHIRHICVAGEELTEPCDDFRQEICIEGRIETSSGSFEESACRVNRWKDCVEQDEQEDCENEDKRDCFWVEGVSFSRTEEGNTGESGSVMGLVEGGDGVCVPNFPPGFKFWEEGEAEGICQTASAQCIVTYEKGLFGSKECKENCECLEDEWAQKMNNICASLGDCGGYVNYVGKYTDDGYEWKVGSEKKELSQSIISSIKSQAGVTGRVVSSGKINGLVVALAKTVSWMIGGSLVSGFPKPGEEGYAAWVDKQKFTYKEIIGRKAPSALPVEGGVVSLVEKMPVYQSAKLGEKYLFTIGKDKINSELLFKSGEDFFVKQDGKYVGVSNEVLTNARIDTSKLEFTKTAEKATDIKGSAFSDLLGFEAGTFKAATATGLQYALIWYGIGQMVGGMAGMEKEQTKALSTALAGGAFTYNILAKTKSLEIVKGLWAKSGEKGLFDVLGFQGAGGPGAMGTGIIASAIIFAVMYKKTSTEIVEFNCKSWQAPTGSSGGRDCEICNDNEGCSEYRCKSLGQACQLLNAGTENEKCDWVNPKDTSSPTIKPWEEVLTKGYDYTEVQTRPPGRGMKVAKDTGDGCVKAFTPLEFGIITNEPAQCKIDYNHTLKFDDMTFWFGESNLFLYNHSQKLSLPSPSSIEAAAPELKHDGTYTLYVRCQDANENANTDEFAIRFCVEKGPDTTPPEIRATSIANNMPVQYNKSSVDLDVYVNEPSECRWSKEDKDYDNMETEMTCSKNVWEMNNNLVYTCKTTLTGIKNRQDNQFYFRCKDQPWANESDRNENKQSYPFVLVGTEPINIIDVKPNGTVKGSTEVVSVWLEAETSNGYKNGEAVCSFSGTGNEADWIEFYETGTELHKQRLDLTEGTYTYYIKCVDLGNNRDDNRTEFTVEVDREASKVARVYRENELLKIITVEDSECRYSNQNCNFAFEDGIDMPYANQTSHVAEWKTDNTYYIRCSDEYGNMPLPNTCSIIIRPYDVVEQKSEG